MASKCASGIVKTAMLNTHRLQSSASVLTTDIILPLKIAWNRDKLRVILKQTRHH